MMTIEEKLDRMILEAGASLLHEAKAKSKKIDIGGAVGKGSFGKEFQQNEARAVFDPAGLAADLGVVGASGSTDLELAVSVLKQAIGKNGTMGAAFKIPKQTETLVNEKQVPAFELNYSGDLGVGNLGRRNAIKFLYATLLAAENAGILRMKKGVVFTRHDTGLPPAIYGRD